MDFHFGNLVADLNTTPDNFQQCQYFSYISPTPHSGRKSRFLAPQDIPDFSGYQLGIGCQCVKAYNNENPITNQKIL